MPVRARSPPGRHDVLAVRGDVGTTAWISCAGTCRGVSRPTSAPTTGRRSSTTGRSRRETGDRSAIRGSPSRCESDVPVAFLAARALQRLPRRHVGARHPWLPQPLPPRVVARARAARAGEPVTITLELEATAWIFEPGHRVRLRPRRLGLAEHLAAAGARSRSRVDPGSIRLALPSSHGPSHANAASPPAFAPAPGATTDEPAPGRGCQADRSGGSSTTCSAAPPRCVVDHGVALRGRRSCAGRGALRGRGRGLDRRSRRRLGAPAAPVTASRGPRRRARTRRASTCGRTPTRSTWWSTLDADGGDGPSRRWYRAPAPAPVAPRSLAGSA